MGRGGLGFTRWELLKSRLTIQKGVIRNVQKMKQEEKVRSLKKNKMAKRIGDAF